MKIKKHLRSFVFNLFGLWIAVQLIKGLSHQGGYQTILLAGLALTVVNLLVKPLIKLVFLPINLITLGAFRWLINVIALYLVTLVVPQLQINSFFFSGFSYQGFVIPAFQLGIFWVYVVTSFLISLVTSFLHWLTK